MKTASLLNRSWFLLTAILVLHLGRVAAPAQFAYFEFRQSQMRAAEDAGQAIVDVVRWGNTNTAFSVEWLARSGTAIAGEDFVGVTNTLHFSPGETNKSVSVTLLDDGLVEDAESARLSFGGFTAGAVTGAVNVAILTIEDNEVPTLLDGGFAPGAGVDNDVFALALQPDGRILLGGQFTGYVARASSSVRARVARLNADGSLDSGSFAATNPNGDVYAIALQADGKALIGGAFTSADDFNTTRLARLHSDGSLDTTFAANVNDELRSIVVQPDGLILVAGRFTSIGSQSAGRVARLQADGTFDSAFAPGSGANGNVRTLIRQDDGRLLIGGQFTSFNGTNRARIARLNANGALDLSFDPGTGADGQVRAIAVQSDGSVLIGGEFNTVNGQPRPALARLLPNGRLDVAFDAQFASNDEIRAILVEPNGAILIGGSFESAGGAERTNLARLYPNGNADPSFLSRNGPDDEVFAMVAQPDGAVIIGGQFLNVDGAPQPHVARLLGDSGTPAVEYAAASYAAAEGGGRAEIGVRRTGRSTNTIAATFFTGSGSGTPGEDYAPTTNTLVFAPLQITNSFDVLLLNDGVAEPTETVSLWLTNATGADPGARQLAELSIVDGAGYGNISVGPPLLSEENLALGALVMRYGPTNLPLVLNYSTRDGTATAGQDYVAASGTFFLAAGQTSDYIPLQALNDSVQEPTETFYLDLRDAQTGVLVATTPVTIANNEAGIGFNPTYYTADEAIPFATLRVVCQWDLAAPVEVDFTTVDTGGARAGIDFVPLSGTLYFTHNGEVRTIAVPIINDGLMETPEVFTVRLTAVRGPAALGASELPVTIGSNDGGIEFLADTFTGAEGGGGAWIKLRRRDDGTNTVTVRLATIDGTAVAGLDYAPTNTILVLPPGDDVHEFLIPITDDAEIELDEAFRVVLSDPSPEVSLGAITSAVVRIPDNDRPGSLLADFRVQPGELRYGSVDNIIVQPDGMILVGGDGILARLTPTGAADTTFNLEAFYLEYIEHVPALQPDGRILVGLVSTNSLLNNHVMTRLLPNGAQDPSFAAPMQMGRTRTLALQPDGYILIGGNYDQTWWGGPDPVTNNALVRLRPDGAVDTNFNAGTFLPRGYYFDLPSTVETLALQADGRILAGGTFTSVAGYPCDRIIRLNTNGTPDAGFFRPANINTNDTPSVLAVVLQPDGKLLVGGSFNNLQGVPRNSLTRLNPDGTVDLAFWSPFAPGAVVRAIELAPNGQCYIGGGQFGLLGYGTSNFVVRLNADGSFDTSFDAGLPPDGAVTDLALLPNGDLLAAGDFTTFGGLPYSRIVKLKATSAPYARLDLSPASVVWSEAAGNLVFEVRRSGETNGTTTVDFATLPGTATPAEDFTAVSGTLTFLPGESVQIINVPVHDDWLFEAEETFRVELSNPTGGTVVLGQFFAEMLTLDNDRGGSLDPAFATGTDPNGPVEVVLMQPDGKILIGGRFGLVNGVSGARYTRLNADGSLDPDFQSGTGGYDDIYTLALQPDGKILLAGEFKSVLGVPRVRIARLHPNGAVDASFTSPLTERGSLAQWITEIALQPDGKIYMGGYFSLDAGSPRYRMARLLRDGTVDTSFNNPIDLADRPVQAIVPLPDGRVLIGGDFVSINGESRYYLARLHANGSLDNTFGVGLGLNYRVTSILPLPDGKMLVAGAFTYINNTPFASLVRLLPNGAIDPGMPSGVGTDQPIMDMVSQADGRILIIGGFNTVNGVPRRGIARLNTDLTLDSGFDIGAGASRAYGAYINSVAVQSDGGIVIGGSFDSISGLTRSNLACLNGQFHSRLSPLLPRAAGEMGLTLFAQPGATYVLQGSTNLLDWIPVRTNTATGNLLPFTDAAAWPYRMYRALQVP